MRFKVSFFMICVSVCLILFVSGCGGGKKKRSSGPAPMPEQNQQAQAPETPAPEQKKTKKKKKKKTQNEGEKQTSVHQEGQLVPEVTLPASTALWTEKEILYVRQAQKDLYDTVIQELIGRLANPDLADEASRLLTQFVRSRVPNALALEEKFLAQAERFKEAEGDPQNAQNRSSSQVQTISFEFYMLNQMQVRQIFEALASSTCDDARRETAAFLAGTIVTDDNKSALDAVVAGYAQKTQSDQITKDEEDILLAFLLLPEKGVKLAAEYADVEPPEVEQEELDQDGNPIPKQDSMSGMRGNHPPIDISPEERVQIKIMGGNGNITQVTQLDIQKQILEKYCPFSTANFRARIAEEIMSQEVLAAADTEAKQAFLLNEVLEKFIMKRDFANAIAHILIYKQPDLDDKWKVTIEDNLLKSCTALTQNHFGFYDEKTLEDYKKAVQAKAAKLMSEKQKRLEAEKNAGGPASSAQVPVSLLSKKAQMTQPQNRGFGNQMQMTQYSPLVELMINPEECSALEKEVWSPELRALLLTRLEETFGALVAEAVANMPALDSNERPRVSNLDKDGLQTLQMYLTIPCIENRAQIYGFLDKAWLLGPELFRQVLFDKIEMEPGSLMVVKSLDRRTAPKEKDKRPAIRKPTKSNKNRPVVREREKSKGVLLREKKVEVGTAWMDLTYNLVCQWCGKFSLAAQSEKSRREIDRILNPKLPKDEVPVLSEELKQKFQPIPGIDVVALYTNSDPEMPPISSSSGLKITFIELRCTNQLPKLISAYKSKNPHLLERGKLNDKRNGMNSQIAVANATWLEKFEVNEGTGRRESIDILFAPVQGEHLMNYSGDINQPRKGAEPYSIYVLVMEMDDLTGDHVSKLGDEDDSYPDEGDDELEE